MKGTRRTKTPRGRGSAATVTATDPASRLEALVEANIAAVHAYQIGLARTSGRGDPACYGSGGLSDEALEAMEGHQSALLAEDPASVRAWVEGRDSSLDPAKDLEPLLVSGPTLAPGLPVNVGPLGLPGSDADLLGAGRELADDCCASPVGANPEEWRIAGRKIWNRGEKNTGVRDARVLAGARGASLGS